MAEALARQLLGGHPHFESAGIWAGDSAAATKDAVQAMKERGLDISAHRSRSLSKLDFLDFDLLIALTPAIAETLRNQGAPVSKIRALDIPDPYGKGLESYRTTADAIEVGLQALFGSVAWDMRGNSG